MELETSTDPRLDLILTQFIEVRRETEKICVSLNEEDYMTSATEDTSPPKWHLAHTTWFFEEFFLKRYDPNFNPFNEKFSFIFNSYYKRLGEYLPKSKRSSLARPSVLEVYDYRETITNRVLEVARANPRGLEIIELGTHHEQQHQELLLMDIKRNFFDNPLRPAYETEERRRETSEPNPRWMSFDAGLHHIGFDKNQPTFAYDNEKDAHPVWIEGFDLSSELVSNGEYLEFMNAGGYENPLLWLSDGWDMKCKEGWSAPLYWEKSGKTWYAMTMSGMKPLDLNAPLAHVSYYEAQAFAQWKGCRLPTEQEWERAAPKQVSGHFMEDGVFDPHTLSGMHGSLWEWTMSSYLPYPRFKSVGHGLSEYNEKFMCNQFVLRGGACVTPRSHYRPTYRNFYYPHMRWQYAGVRLAKDHP